MHIPKKYFHDRIVLLLLSTNVFLALLNTVMTLLRLNSNGSTLKLIQRRPNLGLSGFTYSSSNLVYISFIVFSILVLIFHTVLSMRVFHIRRQFALTVLGLGSILLAISLIVSNALLVQR